MFGKDIRRSIDTALWPLAIGSLDKKSCDMGVATCQRKKRPERNKATMPEDADEGSAKNGQVSMVVGGDGKSQV